MELPIPVDRKEVMAENTYLLTLDGDIDFQPHAVQLLVDLMKKNRNLGAACGRIHPVGSGVLHALDSWCKFCTTVNRYFVLSQVLWRGTKFSNTLSVIGCKRRPNTWSVAYSVVPVVFRCFAAKRWWTTTWCADTRRNRKKPGIMCNTIKVVANDFSAIDSWLELSKYFVDCRRRSMAVHVTPTKRVSSRVFSR